MQTYSLTHIAQVVGATCHGDGSRHIHTLLTDSRSLSFPEQTLFFALCTQRGDGHKYVASLYQRGVRAFVVEHIPQGEMEDATFLVVDHTLRALQSLAQWHRQQFHIPVVGIAGSNGKTTVKEWLYQLLSPRYCVSRSPRSYNSQVGVPLSVWGLWEGTEIGIFETGISQPGEMAALQAVVQPTIGVFTCLGDAHQEFFESQEQKCREKLSLFSHCDVLFYLAGNPVVDRCIGEMHFAGRLVACPSVGDAMSDNAALCRAVAIHLGLDETEADKRVAHLQPVAMRLEVLEGNGGCTIINDTYNSDLKSLDIALDQMHRRPDITTRPRLVVLSDMEQMGIAPHVLYARVATMLAHWGMEQLVGVGPQLVAHAATFAQQGIRARMYASTSELLASQVLANLQHTVVLLKGARSYRFDGVADTLVHKVHQTILEIDQQAIVDNLNHYRAQLQSGVKMVCMVKADAYGAGAVEVARILQEHRVDYLAVAVADEGVTLRRAGITCNIIVMNPEIHSLATLFEHQLEPEVYSFRLLAALVAEAQSQGLTHYPVHLKLDTGMHRLGFDPEYDIAVLVQTLRGQQAVQPRSVFSHFVGSDSDEFDHFSALQFQRFTRAADALQAAFVHHILRHICNSAGISHFPGRQMDMVRLGLGLYGIDARTNATIHNVSTLRTTILQIHDVPQGDSVGYSRRSYVERPSRVAAIPIGYADGLNRRLGNGRAYCLVNGQRAPYVGNICMDVCMIDVTGIACAEGDMVEIFGHHLPVTVLSDAIGTIPYEVLTAVSPRVKRVYFKNR